MKGKLHGQFYKYRGILLIFYFLFLTCLFTRPLCLRIASENVGGYGDNLYFIWQIGWIRQALFDYGEMPYRTHLLNFPYGYNLATTEIAPLQLLIGFPAAIFGNPVLGYNISILATFILAGLTMYYWVYQLTKSWQASLLSSTAFAFLPYHQAHFLSGHLNISSIEWFPLFFMGFFGILTSKNFSWKNIAALSAGLAGIALTSQYYLYMVLFTGLCILILYFIFRNSRQIADWQVWKQFLITFGISFPFLITGILPYYLLHRGGGSTRTLADVMVFSASITDFFLPFTKSIIAGDWVSQNFPRALWNEASLYIGAPIFFLTIYSLIYWRKNERRKHFIWLMAAGAVLAMILAMGTHLTWKEEPLLIHTPELLSGLIKQESFYLLLPGYYLFQHFPFYSLMRAWMRYGIIALTLFCAAAGLGAAHILGSLKKPWKNTAAVALIIFVLIDFLPTPYRTVEIKPRRVDEWLADQPYGGQVQLPLKQSYEESAIYYTLTNHKPLIGVIRTFPSPRYFQLEPKLRGFPDEESVNALIKEQITYIVVDETQYTVDDGFINNAENSGLDYAVSIDGQSVFIIQ